MVVIPPRGRRPSLAVAQGQESIWRDYACNHGREVLLDELELITLDDEGLKVPLTETEIQSRVGEIEAVIERAQFGELVERNELKPVQADPELWELRLWINGKRVRMYHAEPRLYTNLMVGLRAHFKWVAGPSAEVNRRQNMEISRAVSRYKDGADREWRCQDPDALPCPPDSKC